MGLGGARKRTKLTHDPNNTSWSRSTDNYGQKLLLSKGWTPGASLGARNKPYTKSKDASYIRVSLKDDNLGLGAKSGPNLPATGLDAFQGLLGRLNGKNNEELEREQKSRDKLKRTIYTENRWGALRFVSGGFLVGDKENGTSDDHKTTSMSDISSELKSASDKSQSLVAEPDRDSAMIAKKPKKSKKRILQRNDAQLQDQGTTSQDEQRLTGASRQSTVELVEGSLPENYPPSTEDLERRAERAKRKLARQARRTAKEVRRLKRATNGQSNVDEDNVRGNETEHLRTGMASLATPTTIPRAERPNVRARYIQQKRLALGDAKALNEILMIKA